MLYLIPFIAIFLFLIAYYCWSRRHLYAAAFKIKGPRGLPLIGNALLLMGNHEDVFDKANAVLAQVEHEPVKFWLGPFLLIALKNPVHLEKIMSSQKFAYKHEVYELLAKILGDGLITASGLKPKYKIHRRTIQPLIDMKFIESSLNVIQKHIKDSMERLESYIDKDTFDINEEIHKCGINFNAEIILGQNPNYSDEVFMEFYKALPEMYNLGYNRIVKIWLHPDCIYNLFPESKNFHTMVKVIHNYAKEALIDSWKRRKLFAIEQDENKFIPMIDKLAELVEINPHLFDKEDLVNHVLTLFAASEDPFAIIASFAVLCFGMYPEYQMKAAEEIRTVIGEKPRELTLEDIYKLSYLDMCIKDVLRLFPIAPLILRRMTENYELDKWVVPEGAAVIVPIHSLHRDPKYWLSPNHFYPDNFLPENVSKRHVYAYMPFSAGPRGCIGKTIATIQLKLFLVNFMQRFEVEAEGKIPDIKLKCDISVRPKNGYLCKIKKRIW